MAKTSIRKFFFHLFRVEMTVLICFVLLTGTTVSTASVVDAGYTCEHKPLSREEAVYDVRLDPHIDEHDIRKRSADHPLRIHLHYDNSTQQLPQEHIDIIKNLVTEAAVYWENTLLVRPAHTEIRLHRQCLSSDVRYRDGQKFCVDGCRNVTRCGDIVIPSDHLERCYYWDSQDGQFKSNMEAGPGVAQKDFVLYVAALSTSRCNKARTIAYAAHCQQEAIFDRPIAGYFSVCPNSITTEKHDHPQLLSTLKHEILHALGFSAGLYAFYRAKDGTPFTPRNSASNKPDYSTQLNLYQWSDNVVREVTRKKWRIASGHVDRTVKLFVTPSVKREVRQHFNCSTLEGAELENQGIEGTALTHWEKRIFENEAMTGTYTQNPVISRITLALMEDTGWYNVKYEKAEELEWGRNLGCEFAMRSCLDWMDLQDSNHGDIHPFCDTVRQGMLQTDCTKDRQAVAFCNLIEYNHTLDPMYQYFDYLEGISYTKTKYYGGSVVLADYCPFLQEFEWRSGQVTVRNSKCTSQTNNPDEESNFFGEHYGARSRCFNHGSMWQLQQCDKHLSVTHWGSGCYEYECHASQGLILLIGGQSFPCTQPGQHIDVEYVSNSYLHSGSIICPSCEEMCQNSGITCPSGHHSYTIVSKSQLRVPCKASTHPVISPYSLAFSTIVANFLCLMVLLACHS